MVDLRRLIIERVRMASDGPWTLDVYLYLKGHGVTSDDAIRAMTLFADEILAMKKAQAE